MKKIVDFILTANLLFITAAVAYLWYSGDLMIQYKEHHQKDSVSIYGSLASIFGETLKDGVNREFGIPVDGYTPKQLMSSFKGLVYTDFDAVSASVGKYVAVEEQLIHVTTPDTLQHSANGAITPSGFETLLENVAIRTQIDLEHDGTLTQIMSAISN